jgi:hypothetical protein
MSNLHDFEMSSQHKLWHQDHLNWLEDLDVFFKEGSDFIETLNHIKAKVSMYQDDIKRVKSAITDQEIHIKKHEEMIVSHTDTQSMDEEHDDNQVSHGKSYQEYLRLRAKYHKMAVLLHAFEQGWRKIER